jgi:dolichol-phosphate mannosyltransferase
MTSPARKERLDLVLPVRNEAPVIERVIDEIVDVVSRWVDLRILACEDGSTDGTDRVLRRIASDKPLRLIAGPPGRGYARAVCAGIRAAETEYVLVIDADGQCDPRDFQAAWEARTDADVNRGFRTARRDPLSRRVLSRSFKVLYDALFGLGVRDPSCPFVLMRRDVALGLIDRLGTMEVGFWWEFVVWARVAGLRVRDFPIAHRPRLAGRSTAIPLSRVPVVALTHTCAVLRLWRLWRSLPAGSRPAR